MKGNWLKLHRSIMSSDIAQSDELLGLYIRILVNLNFQKGWFKQVEIQPGQMAFAWRTLKKRLYKKGGPSHNTIRSRVQFLDSIGVVKVETHPSQRFSVLTVPDWQKYQTKGVPNFGTVAGTVPGTVAGTDIRRIKNVKEEKCPRFQKPSLEEVRSYCSQRKNSIDPEQFFDHYESNGWVQGKGKPIRNWQAAIRTWERNGLQNKPKPKRDENYPRLGAI